MRWGLDDTEHEQVVVARDDDSGLRCVIAIHSTLLGPSLGGTRMRSYPSLDDAISDALRLSRAMTYKNALAGLDHGGGKGVIVADPSSRSEALLRAYGRVVASLSGRYITACDVGTTPDDMALVRRETRWATGMDVAEGGSGDSGTLTAHGVHLAIRVAVESVYRTSSLEGRHVAVQGLGKVGGRLVEHLLDDGAKVTVADVDEQAVDRFAQVPGVEVVDPDEVLEVDAEVVSPNALGGVLNATTIPRMLARIVCGGANNQLAQAADADRLHDAGILYAPDFVVNSGGVISVADELHPGGYSESRARRRAEAIPDNLRRVIATSRAASITTEAAAAHVAEERIARIGGLRRFWLPAREDAHPS